MQCLQGLRSDGAGSARRSVVDLVHIFSLFARYGGWFAVEAVEGALLKTNEDVCFYIRVLWRGAHPPIHLMVDYVVYSVDGWNLIYSVLIDSVGGKLLGSVGGGSD